MNKRIHSVGFTADQKLIELAEKRVEKLGTFHDQIIDVEVFLHIDEQSSQIKDKSVKVRCNVPGNTLFAEYSSKSLEAGIDEAVDSIRRQLKKEKEKLKAKRTA